ncbi:MAG TPA: MFS transporter [Roseiarcus sp.]|nr:MFS transporter [Roseiarcus sp.]
MALDLLGHRPFRHPRHAPRLADRAADDDLRRRPPLRLARRDPAGPCACDASPRDLGAWGFSAPLIACAVAAPLLLGGFVWREARAPAPLINLSLFRSAAFSAGSVGVLVSYGMLYGMFFAMSFALVRGYHDQPLAAGLRLTIVPVALGLVAPFSGALSDKRPRLLMLAGMAISAAAAMALTRLLDGTPGSLTGLMVGLAAFGVGLGLYIAPNNNATMSAAPADKSGVAGGLLNLLRISGGGVGVAASSAVLAWGLESATGVHEQTAGAPEAALLAAVGDVLVLLALFGALGAAMAVIRNNPKADARKAVGAGAPKPGDARPPRESAHAGRLGACLAWRAYLNTGVNALRSWVVGQPIKGLMMSEQPPEETDNRPKNESNKNRRPSDLQRRIAEAVVLALYFVFEFPAAYQESRERAFVQVFCGVCARLIPLTQASLDVVSDRWRA